MRKFIVTAMLGTLALGLNLNALAADRPAKRELDDHTKAVNELATHGERMQLALHQISVETGVPLEEVRKMHQGHPDAGPAGIMNACVLADNTKKTPEDFLRKHLDGKGWAAIAKDNNVPLEKLNERLDRLENALATDKQNDRLDRKEKRKD